MLFQSSQILDGDLDKKEANKHLTQRKFWKKNRICVQGVAVVGQKA